MIFTAISCETSSSFYLKWVCDSESENKSKDKVITNNGIERVSERTMLDVISFKEISNSKSNGV